MFPPLERLFLETTMYVKRSIPVDAWQVRHGSVAPDWVEKAMMERNIELVGDGTGAALVKTSGTWLKAQPGDWIILGVLGELYPCPHEVFARTYQSLKEGFDFGTAITLLKAGHRVARKGWNGKGMWVSYTPGRDVEPDQFWSPANAAWAKAIGLSVKVRSYLTMKTADNEIVPWVASQSDVLAEDWMIF